MSTAIVYLQSSSISTHMAIHLNSLLSVRSLGGSHFGLGVRMSVSEQISQASK